MTLRMCLATTLPLASSPLSKPRSLEIPKQVCLTTLLAFNFNNTDHPSNRLYSQDQRIRIRGLLQRRGLHEGLESNGWCVKARLHLHHGTELIGLSRQASMSALDPSPSRRPQHRSVPSRLAKRRPRSSKPRPRSARKKAVSAPSAVVVFKLVMVARPLVSPILFTNAPDGPCLLGTLLQTSVVDLATATPAASIPRPRFVSDEVSNMSKLFVDKYALHFSVLQL